MKVLIDIAHPAHVHYFRNFAKNFNKKGHTCLFTLRDKGIIVELADFYGLDYVVRSKESKSKLKYFVTSIFNIYKIARKFKPDVFLDMGTIVAAPISKIFRKPYIAFDDTEASTKARLLHMPFTNAIITPNEFYKNLGKKHIRFESLMEIMYLHKNYFTINGDIIRPYLSDISNLTLIRFVSWEAHHDKGKKGITNNKKMELIKYLSLKYKVIISSEAELPSELKKYQVTFPTHLMHQVLAQSKLVITEGATMATEAVLLGIPTIYINSIQNGNSVELQKKGLLFSLIDDSNLFETVNNAISLIENIEKFKKNHDDFIKEKIDGTAFLDWFIETYPESVKIMKENPDYQYNFK
ncbi:MAG TPA: hypothetical protein DCG75_17610 [Bacteroidales bacterium]|nr:hypothetical protein [Bacteroidales bacterium]